MVSVENFIHSDNLRFPTMVHYVETLHISRQSEQWRRQLVGMWAWSWWKKIFSLYVETSCLVCFGTMPNSNSALFVQPYSHWNDTVTGYNGACAKANVVFTARRYSAVFAVVRCPSTWWTNERIRPFVHHVRALYPDGWRYRQIYLSAGSPMILVFDTKRRCSIPKGTPSVGAQNIRGWEKFAILFWNRRLSQKR